MHRQPVSPRTVLCAMLTLAVSGCDLGILADEPEPECEVRTAFYPDEDGDGVGDAGEIYIGCEAPEGWVDVPPPSGETDDTDTGDTGDTDTGDSDTGDTDTGDTGDTDTGDTDTGDSDTGGEER